ncbi:MAG: MFS transporter [Rhodospirillales bacterium]|jgi:acyl-[acyl-carrier-protein]-phospholipid O-acyltransferase/long-chain-fatty-acid--[acyl-carrier-protein] ligase
MDNGTFALLTRRRFWPLFVGQFLGAANDNFFKNALIMLVIYKLGAQAGMEPKILATVAAGLFIAPYFLFSALAGEMSDRFEKSRLMKAWKAAEIVISAIGAAALLAGYVPLMLAALFLLGLQSTFTGPIKYAVLPEYLKNNELIGGNALIEGGTFLAILLGTIGGGTLALLEDGEIWVSIAMMALAILGFAASLRLPQAHGGNRQVSIGIGLIGPNVALWRLVRGHPDLLAAIMGISWFWLVGATYLTQFPAFAKDSLNADGPVVTLMLTMFSIGIGLGSVLCGRLLKGKISTRHVPWAALGMSLFATDLYFAAANASGDGDPLRDLAAFLAAPSSWRVLADLLAFSICGGVYIVPLYVILQTRSAEASRARVVAANNVANAVFMVVSSLACAALLAAGIGITDLFLGLAALNLIAAWLLRRL